MTDFNPRFPRGKQHFCKESKNAKMQISTHASRGGSDAAIERPPHEGRCISIHASRGGSDPPLEVHKVSIREFQSTLPAGEATLMPTSGSQKPRYFNPRFPRGKRLLRSILRALSCIFQSTLPAGEATVRPAITSKGPPDFNPRFPRGKRPGIGVPLVTYSIFQSTLPAGEATDQSRICGQGSAISIHASRGGSDDLPVIARSAYVYFNPRFPRGKRHFPL